MLPYCSGRKHVQRCRNLQPEESLILDLQWAIVAIDWRRGRARARQGLVTPGEASDVCLRLTAQQV